MRVKVIKDMPFAKVGDILESEKNYISYYKEGMSHTFDEKSIQELIKDGWVEVVTRKLKDVIYDFIYCYSGPDRCFDLEREIKRTVENTILKTWGDCDLNSQLDWIKDRILEDLINM